MSVAKDWGILRERTRNAGIYHMYGRTARISSEDASKKTGEATYDGAFATGRSCERDRQMYVIVS